LFLLLLKPAFGVPTSWAYSKWRDAAEVPGFCYSPQKFAGIELLNDLERPVFEKYPLLGQMKMWLLRQPEVGAALMSGSGSTMMALLRDPEGGDLLSQRAQSELDPEIWTCACTTAIAAVG
jgi:4-diphosphocytidyl-2-C-methyl-D-erythritol kinase